MGEKNVGTLRLEVLENSSFFLFLSPEDFWSCKEVCREWRAVVMRKGRSFLHQQVLTHAWTPWERQKAWRFFLLDEIRLKDCDFLQLANKESEFDAAIRRDVNRTLPKETDFKVIAGQNYLFRVLRAWANRLWEIGYCQGLNFLAATLLKVFDMDEEVAFRCGVALLLRCNMLDYFRPEFPKVGVTVWTFDRLVAAMLPKVHEALMKHDVRAEYYAMSWFLTMFASELPQSQVHHIWDLFLTYGPASVYQIGLALLYRIQDYLVTLDADHMLRYLKIFTREKNITQWDSNDLIRTAFRFPVSFSMVHALETCYYEYPDKRNNIELFTVRDLSNNLTHWSVDIVEGGPEFIPKEGVLPQAFTDTATKKKIVGSSPLDFLMHNMDTGETEIICDVPEETDPWKKPDDDLQWYKRMGVAVTKN